MTNLAPRHMFDPIIPATLALILGGFATQGHANEAGRTEYVAHCAACHGIEGRGDGPVAAYLTVATPALTSLARANDGVFPMLNVIQVIDGRSGVGPHGTGMPVWGTRFVAETVDDAGRFGAEIIVRGRILALAEYLQTIQD